jgi:hypothetical protein
MFIVALLSLIENNILSRTGNSFKKQFPAVVEAVERLRPKRFVIGGDSSHSINRADIPSNYYSASSQLLSRCALTHSIC